MVVNASALEASVEDWDLSLGNRAPYVVKQLHRRAGCSANDESISLLDGRVALVRLRVRRFSSSDVCSKLGEIDKDGSFDARLQLEVRQGLVEDFYWFAVVDAR